MWLKMYNNAPRPGSRGTTEKRATPLTDTSASRRWEEWVGAKLIYDRFLAQREADISNTAPGTTPTTAPPPAPLPGLIPADLLAAVGNPPTFYAAVLPRRYTITFDNGEVISYTDNIALGNSRNPSYRFAQGVRSFGLRLRDWSPDELSQLFSQAGLTSFEQNVVKAVSGLEGGFDSINTYDTGFVSVGFIQFASLGGGAGSLGAVLKQQKETQPYDFQQDFRRFGVDVDAAGTLVVVDPATGAEVRGLEANLKIINDKRLIAVFERAGRTRHFQIAQIQIAKRNYYPADEPVTLTLGGRDITIKAGDVIRSEAGMATLFDRKVNTGTIRLMGEVLTRFAKERNLTQVEQFAPFERELIPLLKWRTDFLADPKLAQPK